VGSAVLIGWLVLELEVLVDLAADLFEAVDFVELRAVVAD
jgi:hypothetical protein